MLTTYTSTRSVFTILWGCVTTTFLCAWVSVHPNLLPQLGEGWERVGQKVRLLLVTVIMPELVVGWAWKERIAARRIKRQLSEKGKHLPSFSFQSLNNNPGFKISMAHAHFIEMGGFALCLPEEKLREAFVGNEDSQELPRNENEIIRAVDDELSTIDDEVVSLRYVETLSAKRLKDLLVNSSVKFPKISKCELQDRSKSDSLAKFITAVQALWFVIQCIVRSAMGLAVTELELTTLALASLNLYTLWSWRDKPQNVGVQVPVYLMESSGEWVEIYEMKKGELAQRMREDEKQKELRKRTTMGQRCLESLKQLLATFRRGFMAVGQTENNEAQQEEGDDEEDQTEQGLFSETIRMMDNFIEDVSPFVVDHMTESRSVSARELPAAPFHRLVSYFSHRVKITREWWSKVCLRSWKGWAIFIWDILLLMLIRLPFWIINRIPANIPLLISIPVLFLLVKSRRVCNFFDAYLKQGRTTLILKDVFEYGLQAALVGTVFGGLHLVGWNFSFPTTVERWIWRSMSLTLAIMPLWAAASAILLVVFSRGGRLEPRMTVSYSHFLVAAFFLYVVARLCILVLALELLRNQPTTAYLAVDWIKFLPHASS